MSPRPVEALLQAEDGGWLSFSQPVRVIAAHQPCEVEAALVEVERDVRASGCHAIGFVTFEAAAAYGLSVARAVPDLPLVWFALFEPRNVSVLETPPESRPYTLGECEPSINRQTFARAFAHVKHQIADGNTYQVNFTFRIRSPFAGDARGLFADLSAAQGGRYGVFLQLARWSICSVSPELFFSRNGDHIVARPMKGTLRRGRTLDEDLECRDALTLSPKQRAENVMVVDMVRNDLGRVAMVGSVSVPSLWDAERYPGLWQMTSTVTARSSEPLAKLFAALHPSASVTGAPKASTMRLLAGLEDGPRGVYTGAVGHVRPDGSARFNVAIRTAVVDHDRGQVELGVGSGIVWDSNEEDEYRECLLKAGILGRAQVEFRLLETLRWSPDDGFFLLDRHLARLAASAEYFGFTLRATGLQTALSEAVAGRLGAHRVRLLVGSDGAAHVECLPLPSAAPATRPLRVAFAREPIDANDVFLFHKTTHRGVYDRARIEGVDDVLLWNQRGEVTEATMANVVIELEDGPVTPAVGCGLLAGTYRAELIASGALREAVVTRDDVRRAKSVWLINSVQERRAARLVE